MTETSEGICCEFCKKQESSLCPIESASPWSRWKNFCNEFEDEEGDLYDRIRVISKGN